MKESFIIKNLFSYEFWLYGSKSLLLKMSIDVSESISDKNIRELPKVTSIYVVVIQKLHHDIRKHIFIQSESVIL